MQMDILAGSVSEHSFKVLRTTSLLNPTVLILYIDRGTRHFGGLRQLCVFLSAGFRAKEIGGLCDSFNSLNPEWVQRITAVAGAVLVSAS
jgi:hypothetical protein